MLGLTVETAQAAWLEDASRKPSSDSGFNRWLTKWRPVEKIRWTGALASILALARRAASFTKLLPKQNGISTRYEIRSSFGGPGSLRSCPQTDDANT